MITLVNGIATTSVNPFAVIVAFAVNDAVSSERVTSKSSSLDFDSLL